MPQQTYQSHCREIIRMILNKGSMQIFYPLLINIDKFIQHQFSIINKHLQQFLGLHMSLQQDPFQLFQKPQQAGQKSSEPKKRTHLDPFAQLEVICLKEIRIDDAKEKQIGGKPNKNIQIMCQQNDEEQIHEVYFPEGYKKNIYEGNCNALKYEFKLDSFQEKAIKAIECDESVLVAAHTSAGKTAIAEYAIAKSLKVKSRVVYTSPIKALSNQKFRELKKKFGSVGLITGDSKIDKNSECLVMTTQILRSMIYEGSDILREIKWVIFDEIHYIQDVQRGFVWQEVIMMMPSSVNYLFLSATIGNPEEFARWVAKIRNSACHLVKTNERPVPLQHYICPIDGEGIYLVVDSKKNFKEKIFQEGIQKIEDKVDVIGTNPRSRKSQTQGANIAKLITFIIRNNMDPAIVFCFSKKDVQATARAVVSKFDLTKKHEKESIREYFSNAIMMLDEEDRDLLPVTSIQKILERGIGIHHGGLLPIIKEIVELLFQEGLIKVLFSTETFSMGVNMPTRTVVFSSIKKFDGGVFRCLQGGQYTQMAGRAGRRGRDEKGTSIVIMQQKISEEVAKEIFLGKSSNLTSSFTISYRMLLNSYRQSDLEPQVIIGKSFLQYQHEAKKPLMISQYEKKYKEYQDIIINDEESVSQLSQLQKRKKELKIKLKKLIFKPQKIIGYFTVGRIVRVKVGSIDWGYGCVINFSKNKKKSKDVIEVIVDIAVCTKKKQIGLEPEPTSYSDPNGQITVLMFTLECVWEITSCCIKLPTNLIEEKNKITVKKTLQVLTQYKFVQIEIESQLPEVKIIHEELSQIDEQIEKVSQYENQLPKFEEKQQFYEQLKEESKKISESESLVLKKEKKSYTKAIKRLGLIEHGIITLKGKVACQISGNQQLLLTQLLFSGFFNDLNPSELAAIMSTFINDEKGGDNFIVKNKKLSNKFQEIIRSAKKLYEILHECKVPIEQDEYLANLKEQLIDLTYAWCQGASFGELYRIRDTYEGTVVRCLRRLNELLSKMRKCAEVIGNEELEKSFEKARQRVYRGIVQSSSLYTV